MKQETMTELTRKDIIDWNMAIVGRPVNGYTLVEIDGKFNFLKSGGPATAVF